jgi:hypothetical protein
MSKSTSWSYSSLKTFEQCPKKYYHLKVAQDVKDTGSQATRYGNEVHKAAEEHIKTGTPLPPQFRFIQSVLDVLKNIPGEKHCELRLGIRKTEKGYEPCDFLAPDYWWHGIGDLVIINGALGFSVDYKTSKNAKYADTKQLDILAAALFVYFPELEKIKSGLIFVASNEFIRKDHYAEHRDKYFESFMPLLDRLDSAYETDVWNTNTGPLCGFCPVTQCDHNRRK